MEIGTDVLDGLSGIEFLSHVVGYTHVVVETDVRINVPDPEMMT